jgi:hypothetical protein
MFLANIFYALCDAFTLTEMQQAEASTKLIYIPICGDEFIPSYFYEETESSKSQIKSDEKLE